MIGVVELHTCFNQQTNGDDLGMFYPYDYLRTGRNSTMHSLKMVQLFSTPRVRVLVSVCPQELEGRALRGQRLVPSGSGAAVSNMCSVCLACLGWAFDRVGFPGRTKVTAL